MPHLHTSSEIWTFVVCMFACVWSFIALSLSMSGYAPQELDMGRMRTLKSCPNGTVDQFKTLVGYSVVVTDGMGNLYESDSTVIYGSRGVLITDCK